MDKQVNKESLASMATLQKGYIDQGDQKNSEAISAVSEKVDGLLMGADFAVAEYVPGSTDYLPKSSLGIGKDILNYFTPVYLFIEGTQEYLQRGVQKATPLQKNNFFKADGANQYVAAIGFAGEPEIDTGFELNRVHIRSMIESDSTDATQFILVAWEVLSQIPGGSNIGYDLTFNQDVWYIPNDGLTHPNGHLPQELIVEKGTPYLEGVKLIKKFEKRLFDHWSGRMPFGDIRNNLFVINLSESDLDTKEVWDISYNPPIGEDGNLLTAIHALNANEVIQGQPLPIMLSFPWEYAGDLSKNASSLVPYIEFGLANNQPLYLCDGLTGKSGKVWKGVFTRPEWDGINLSQWELPCTAIGFGPMTTYQNNYVTTQGVYGSLGYFSLSPGISNCQSNKGILATATGNWNPFVDSTRNYPRVNDINQPKNMEYIRKRNLNSHTAGFPYAEGGYFAHNVFITAMELAAGTKFIHAANLFGSGISSNDGCNANNFFTSGGVRFRVKDQGDGTPGPWQYKTFGQNCAPLQYNASGATTDMSNLLTQYYPKEQCMESQMVASMATEMGIAPAVEPNEDNIQDFLFPFYGRSYYYMNVPGFEGLQEGQMNCRVYKYMRHDVQLWYNGEPATIEMEVIYRMSLFMGVNLTGDIWAYYGGGLEMVGTPKEGATAGSTGNQIDIYIEPDQKKWRYTTAITTPAGTKFDFEETGSFAFPPYRHILTATNLGDSYTLTRGSYTPWKTAKASSMAQGECYYQWDNAHWISGTNRVRVKSLFRSGSYYAFCSPRNLHANNAASHTYRDISGSAQVLVEFE